MHTSLGKVKPMQDLEMKVNKKRRNNNPEPPAPSKQVCNAEGAPARGRAMTGRLGGDPCLRREVG